MTTGEKDNMAKEREQWDGADLTESVGASETIVRPAQKMTSTLTIRLDTETIDRIRETAQVMGVGISQLVRSWILEKTSKTSRVSGDKVVFDLNDELIDSIRANAAAIADIVMGAAGVALPKGSFTEEHPSH